MEPAILPHFFRRVFYFRSALNFDLSFQVWNSHEVSASSPRFAAPFVARSRPRSRFAHVFCLAMSQSCRFLFPDRAPWPFFLFFILCFFAATSRWQLVQRASARLLILPFRPGMRVRPLLSWRSGSPFFFPRQERLPILQNSLHISSSPRRFLPLSSFILKLHMIIPP